MREFEELIEIRNVEVEGISPWYWNKKDHGAFEGPSEDIAPMLKLIKKHRRGNSVIVQAGGCLGLYPRIFSDHFETVYTFEPDPLSFFVLSMNCQKENIVKLNAALGSHHTLVRMYRESEVNVGMNRIAGGAGCYIPMLKIDDLGLKHCDVLQLDTEQTELGILWGALETIERFRPIIILENPPDVVKTLLYEIGYKMSEDRSMRYDALFLPSEQLRS